MWNKIKYATAAQFFTLQKAMEIDKIKPIVMMNKNVKRNTNNMTKIGIQWVKLKRNVG